MTANDSFLLRALRVRTLALVVATALCACSPPSASKPSRELEATSREKVMSQAQPTTPDTPTAGAQTRPPRLKPRGEALDPDSIRVVTGPAMPTNGQEDGSVRQVKEYIATHVRNPETVEFVKWYPVQKYERGYYVRCRYRTDGGSFGIIDEDKIFYMTSRGRVIRTAAGTGTLDLTK